MRSLEAIERGSGTTGPLCCSGLELRAMCAELRTLRRAMRTVVEESRCGASVRAMRRALRHDLCGVVDAGNAIAADGFGIRGLLDLEQVAVGANNKVAGITERELSTLIAEVRRHRRKLHELLRVAAGCPRTRAFAARVLARNDWASATDGATYAPPPRDETSPAVPDRAQAPSRRY